MRRSNVDMQWKNYNGIQKVLYFTYYILDEFKNRNTLRYAYLEFVLTTKCNLNCENCAHLMNHYNDHHQYSFDEFKENIDLLFETVDYVIQLRLLGGEPFLNRDLGKFLEYMLSDENISKKFSEIGITTNGTVVPDKKALEVMSDNKRTKVFISNYGEKSKRNIKLFNEKNISFELESENQIWFDPGQPVTHNRSVKELKKMYKGCYLKDICNSYFDGEFHVCSKSNHGTRIGLIPKREEDFARLKSCDSLQERRSKLLSLKKIDYIIACDYCDFMLKKPMKSKSDVSTDDST